MDLWGAPLYGDPCRECGFRWAMGQSASTEMMRQLPDSVDELVTSARGGERIPELRWNVSAYVSHMTDNTRIWAERMIAVARGADAGVVAYDDNLLGEARRYNDVALEGAKWSLRMAVESWLDAVEEAELAAVTLAHSKRGAMTVGDVVESNAHDSHHHCWDLTRILDRR